MLNRPGMSGDSLLGRIGVMSAIRRGGIPPELRERAVRMVAEVRAQHDSRVGGDQRGGGLLGVGAAETVRKWIRRPRSIPGRVRG